MRRLVRPHHAEVQQKDRRHRRLVSEARRQRRVLGKLVFAAHAVPLALRGGAVGGGRGGAGGAGHVPVHVHDRPRGGGGDCTS